MKVFETPYHFELSFNYNPLIIAKLREIGGGRFNPIRKIWTMPLEARTEIEKLKKRFGTLDATENVDFSNIPDLPELNVEIPLKRPLFKFQETGVAYCLEKKRVIIGDQPGLGKTSQAIAALVAANAWPALIICPASLKYNWQSEFEKVAGIQTMILSDRVKATWPTFYKVGMINVFIVNYESLKKYFVESIEKHFDKNGDEMPLRLNHIRFRESINLFKSVVLDEIHRVKESKTQSAKFCAGIAKGKEFIIGMTGTPVVNKPKDLISQLGIIGRLPEFGGHKIFLQKYCDGDGNGSSNLNELNFRLKTTCFFQRKKTDVLKDLPDKVRQVILCDITTRKEYLDAINNLGQYLKKYREKTEAEVQKSLLGEIMVLMGVCKNISARGKLNEVFEHIDEVTEAGEKIVVFIHQKEIASKLLERYPKAVTIRGADSTEARDANVKAFQNNPAVKIIICNIKAGGVGITLTASSRVAFVELPWHPADCEQCEDRCIAEGQLIMTTEGFKKVEDVKIGHFVYTGNGRFRPVLDAWNRLERKRAFVSIKYKGFSEPLIVTSDHEILIHDGNSTKYIPAGQLDILEHRLVFAAPTNGDIEAINIPLKFGNDFINHKGTTVKVNRVKNPLPELELTPNLMFGFGWYLAEGWSSLAKTREKGSFVAICGNAAKEKELVKQLAVMFKTVFNLDCKIHFSENGANCFSACLYSKNLASFFLEEFGNGSENKRIPQFVYNSKPGLKRAFLEGYYAGDGYRRKNTQQASTKSSTIATQLAQLEAGFGNPVTIRKTAWNGWSFEYSDPGKVSRQSLIKSESGMILFPIQEIKTFRPGKGKDRVYDLTVEGDESFVVGLATVHNCHRIGQKDSVQATYFLGKNTIDEDIFEMIEAKRTISETVTGSIDNIQTQIIDRLSEKLLKRTESHGAN